MGLRTARRVPYGQSGHHRPPPPPRSWPRGQGRPSSAGGFRAPPACGCRGYGEKAPSIRLFPCARNCGGFFISLRRHWRPINLYRCGIVLTALQAFRAPPPRRLRPLSGSVRVAAPGFAASCPARYAAGRVRRAAKAALASLGT